MLWKGALRVPLRRSCYIPQASCKHDGNISVCDTKGSLSIHSDHVVPSLSVPGDVHRQMCDVPLWICRLSVSASCPQLCKRRSRATSQAHGLTPSLLWSGCPPPSADVFGPTADQSTAHAIHLAAPLPTEAFDACELSNSTSKRSPHMLWWSGVTNPCLRLKVNHASYARKPGSRGGTDPTYCRGLNNAQTCPPNPRQREGLKTSQHASSHAHRKPLIRCVMACATCTADQHKQTQPPRLD